MPGAERAGRTVRIDDLAVADGWPAFVEPARQLGLASALCLELFVHERPLGR